MAQKQKRPSPLEEPPTASSSDHEEDQQPSSHQHDDDEDEEDDEEQASSDDDDEDEDQPSSQPSSKNPPPPPPNSNPKPASSDSETETDSESDSEPAPAPSAKVKPLASKPMNQTPKSKIQQASATAASRSTAKRPADNNGHVSDPRPNPKRAKKKGTDSASAAADEAEEDGKKSGDESKKIFQRLWSEEDEIAILKGMIEFTSKTGTDPYKQVDALHDFLKRTQSLHANASTNQLKQKIRRLKNKFDTNAGKGKNGDNFSKPHDQRSFELSKKIWGNAAAVGGGGGGGEAKGGVEKAKTNEKGAKSPTKDTKSNPKPKHEPKSELVAVDSKEAGKMDVDVKTDTTSHLLEVIRLDKGMGLYGLNEDVVKRGVELMGASKRAELEEQWKELQVAELELYVKRAELVANHARLILEAYKSSNN